MTKKEWWTIYGSVLLIYACVGFLAGSNVNWTFTGYILCLATMAAIVLTQELK